MELGRLVSYAKTVVERVRHEVCGTVGYSADKALVLGELLVHFRMAHYPC